MMIFATGSFFLALLVLLKRQDKIGRAFFIFNISVTVWGVFHAIEISQNINYETALFCARLGQASAVFIMPTWFHLALIINEKEKKYRKWLVLSYVIALAIDCFTFSRWFIPYVAPTIEFNYYHRRGPAYDFFTALFFVFIPFGFFNLIQKIKRSIKEEAVQLIGFSIATMIGFIGGTFCFFPIYDIPVPQYNLLIMPIYPFLFSYFMIRHKLFDVEQIIESFQREKLAALGLLAASVNHEIKNPLYAAKSLVDSYLENTKEGLKPKDPIELSIKVSHQLSRALDVITKLNRFAKPASDSISKNLKASIPEALQTVLDLVSYEFSLDKIKIVNQIDPNLPFIKADQRQLEEILFNLIVNACHAMEKGEELVIASECLSSPNAAKQSALSFPHAFSGNLDPRLKSAKIRSGSAEKFGGHSGMTGKIQIIIQDTGSGISKDQMKHLFEPFHTTKGDKGTGLGLYITKQLVERNDGKISVKSEAGKGTNFILEFRTS